MRIVIATTTGFHLSHLAREWIAMGHNVRYMSYLPEFRIRQQGIPRANVASFFWKLQPTASAALFRYLPSIQRPRVESMLERMDDAVAKNLPPCDVFVGLSSMAVSSAKVAKRTYGATVFIDRGSRHVLSQNELLVGSGGTRLTDFYIERELASYEIADYISLPSGHAVQSFTERGFSQNKLFRNPYGVAFSHFLPTPAPKLPLKLLFVGGWSHQKGVDVLSAALDKLPDCALTHAGMRVDVDYPATQTFTALGHVPRERLPEIFAAHHILVLPSRQDGFGMVLLEALAAGLGVVASQMTGGSDIREVMERKDLVELVNPGSVEELVCAIQKLAGRLPSEGSERHILSNADKAYFSWRAYAQRYADFVKAVL